MDGFSGGTRRFWSTAGPCASSTGHGPYLCPVLSAAEAGGGELEKLGREVWEPCRNAGLGAGACQAQMGSLVVVKIIQPLLKTQAQQPDPTAPVVAIPTGAVSVLPFPSLPGIWDLQLPVTCHMFPTPRPLCSARARLSPCPYPRDEHPDPAPTPLLGKPHPCGCSHPLCRFLFLFECAQVSCLLF